MEEIESFRYHCRNVMRSVIKQAIREVRLKEIKKGLLHSEKLKTYFEDNPRDLQLLQHDLPLHPAVVKPHLGNVPDHLIPAALCGLVYPRKKWRKMPFFRKAKKVKTQNPLCDFKHRGKKPKPPAKPSSGCQSLRTLSWASWPGWSGLPTLWAHCGARCLDRLYFEEAA